jgi:serine/threonine protein kinase
MNGQSEPERHTPSSETTHDVEGDCARYEAEWRAGEGAELEAYLQPVSGAERDRLLARLLRIELERRRRRGEQPRLAEYHQRFPDDGPLIAEAFAVTESRLSRALGDPHDAPISRVSATTEFPSDATNGVDDVPLHIGEYQIEGEIDRGGMGLILRGHDPSLDRELAFKVIRGSLKDRPAAVRRFVAEAQITGQLQHPGIPPVHELGRCPDGRPYFSMKLIKGHTLEKLLAERSSPTQDLPRFLKIFEQICQTVAFAHSRGVIHRDLKPLNIMVGAFGELQIMDWGLAARLHLQTPSSPDTAPASWTDAQGIGYADEAELTPAEKSVRPDSDDSDLFRLTQQGQPVGTFPYVPPEQARGEVEHMDERCDVFGLGAILCEILTGEPPYTGTSSEEIVEKARAGDVGQALKRLDECGADAQLITLARLCLAPACNQRSRNGQVVADIVTNILVDQQQIDTRRQIETAVAQERARLVRHYRRVVALVCVFLALPLLAGFVLLLITSLRLYFP